MNTPDNAPERSWSERAAHVVPGGAATGSKRPGALYGELHSSARGRLQSASHKPSDSAGHELSHDSNQLWLPTHMQRAWGCRIETVDGRVLVDCTMALGAVAFGYADPDVNNAVVEAIHNGNVGGLSPRLEVEVAERLVDVVPCAEQVRFLKTGAEATSAAVKLARAATGRSTVIASGYFGWHDWSNPGVGVPPGAHADVVTVPFDDVVALRVAVTAAGSELAAIVVEPLVHQVASREWLQAARDACDQVSAVLVFDEIKTAFRICTGGVQELLGVIPDLTSIGKAMANGFPIAAVVGRRDVMDLARSAWISSTLASETAGLAAANAVLDRHHKLDVCAELARTGNLMQQAIGEALAHTDCVCDGPPAMWRVVGGDGAQLDRLVALAVGEGVLLKRGAYQFASLAHDEPSLATVHAAIRRAAEAL